MGDFSKFEDKIPFKGTQSPGSSPEIIYRENLKSFNCVKIYRFCYMITMFCFHHRSHSTDPPASAERAFQTAGISSVTRGIQGRSQSEDRAAGRGQHRRSGSSDSSDGEHLVVLLVPNLKQCCGLVALLCNVNAKGKKLDFLA